MGSSSAAAANFAKRKAAARTTARPGLRRAARLRLARVKRTKRRYAPHVSGHQSLPLNSTSMKRVFGYFLRNARRASRRPAENPPMSPSGLSLKKEAISPPVLSNIRTDIRTDSWPIKYPQCFVGGKLAGFAVGSSINLKKGPFGDRGRFLFDLIDGGAGGRGGPAGW